MSAVVVVGESRLVEIPVTASHDVLIDDPEVAFVAQGVAAVAADYVPAAWAAGQTWVEGEPVIVEYLVGPEGTVIDPGVYDAWVRLLGDNPEVPWIFSGLLYVGQPIYGVTVADVEVACERALTAAEGARVDQLIPALIATLERWANRTFAPTVYTGERHVIDATGRLLLWHGPVTAVTAVTVDDAAVTDATVLTGWAVNDFVPGQVVVVDYAAGEPMDAGVRQVIIDGAARAVLSGAAVSSGAITAFSVEGLSVTYGGAGTGTTDVGRVPVADLNGIRRLKRRVYV